ncbi:hypothetical protein J4E81_009791 [Alternaria sp. BMP 2799]|nr:hypothetical protein J4E81_009791 [Alternaria sp. BMP 2799]
MTKEARPLHEQFAGIDGDDGLLEEPPDDPEGASFDDLRTLHLEKDQLYQAQEDYYHALRLQILSNIEDRISFYNFGYAPEDEQLTKEEEVHLLPFDIDMAETPTPRL